LILADGGNLCARDPSGKRVSQKSELKADMRLTCQRAFSSVRAKVFRASKLDTRRVSETMEGR